MIFHRFSFHSFCSLICRSLGAFILIGIIIFSVSFVSFGSIGSLLSDIFDDSIVLKLEDDDLSSDIVISRSVEDKAIFSSSGYYPGYTEVSELYIENDTDSEVYIRGSAKFISGSQIFMDALDLNVISGDDELYEGRLADADILLPYPIQPKRSLKLELALKLPAHADNLFADKKVSFDFQFYFSDDPLGIGLTGDLGDDNDPEDQDADKTSSGSSSGGGLHSGGSYPLGRGYDFSEGPGAASLSGNVVIFDKPDFSLKTGYGEGTWVLSDGERNLWSYKLPSGELIRSGFAYLFNPYSKSDNAFSWYYFDKEGIMGSSWINAESDTWYFGHDISDGDLGSIKTGWHKDRTDGRTYYLSPSDGRMQTGILKLSSSGREEEYFLARLEDTYKQNWFLDTALGRWIYDMLGDRTYGSLYIDEQAPDGRFADSNGVLHITEK